MARVLTSVKESVEIISWQKWLLRVCVQEVVRENQLAGKVVRQGSQVVGQWTMSRKVVSLSCTREGGMR